MMLSDSRPLLCGSSGLGCTSLHSFRNLWRAQKRARNKTICCTHASGAPCGLAAGWYFPLTYSHRVSTFHNTSNDHQEQACLSYSSNSYAPVHVADNALLPCGATAALGVDFVM